MSEAKTKVDKIYRELVTSMSVAREEMEKADPELCRTIDKVSSLSSLDEDLSKAISRIIESDDIHPAYSESMLIYARLVVAIKGHYGPRMGARISPLLGLPYWLHDINMKDE